MEEVARIPVGQVTEAAQPLPGGVLSQNGPFRSKDSIQLSHGYAEDVSLIPKHFTGEDR
jgi:hypothetical protein